MDIQQLDFFSTQPGEPLQPGLQAVVGVEPPPAGLWTREEWQQQPLIVVKEWWEQYWQGMPEFIQEDQSPAQTVYVHFERWEDVEEFSRLVGQRITPLTRAIWYPEAEIGVTRSKRYVDAQPPALVDGVEEF